MQRLFHFFTFSLFHFFTFSHFHFFTFSLFHFFTFSLFHFRVRASKPCISLSSLRQEKQGVHDKKLTVCLRCFDAKHPLWLRFERGRFPDFDCDAIVREFHPASP